MKKKHRDFKYCIHNRPVCVHIFMWHKWQVPVSLYGLTQEERDAIGYIDYHNINDNEPDDDE